MRGKRSKQYRKLMQRYVLGFGFREPYQVLVDAQMIQDAHRFSMDLVGQLGRTLHGNINPMITNCSIRHIYALPVSDSPSADESQSSVTPATKTALLNLSKTLTMRRCNHQELASPLSALECISSVIDPKSTGRNPHNLISACHDERLRTWARAITGLPSIFVKRSVMVMEPMSESSTRELEGKERGKLRAGARKPPTTVKRKRDDDEGQLKEPELSEGAEAGGSVMQRRPLVEDADEKKKRKAKGPKGPNPLSVRKKVRKDDGVIQNKARSNIGVEPQQKEGLGDQDHTRPRKRKRKAHPGITSTPLVEV